MLTLTKFQISEKPMCFGFLSVQDDTEVLAYPDMVVYASGVQEGKPFTSNKFSVSHQVSNAVFTCQGAEATDKFHSFFGIGVASLVHHLEDYRKCHAFVDDAKSEDIDVIRSLTGMSFRMSLAMRSVLMTHSAISRWILRNEEAASASLSKADASFVYATRCTLQRAHIIMLIALILAKFISFPKCSLNIENKSLLL